MLNLSDPWIVAAFALSIGSSLLCVAWGILRWNEKDPVEEPPDEIRQWTLEEAVVEDKL